MSNRSHSFKTCHICRLTYPASALWCPVCYDIDGHRIHIGTGSVTLPTAKPAPSALSNLRTRIVLAGYWINLQAIASGKQLGTFPVDLARACVEGRTSDDIEKKASHYLKQIFGVEAEASHV